MKPEAARAVGPTSAREMKAKGQSFETPSSLMGKTGYSVPRNPYPVAERRRDLFPLPKIHAKAGPNIGHSMSVHSKHRRRRRKHNLEQSNLLIDALNEMNGWRTSSPSEASYVQLAAQKHFTTGVHFPPFGR